MQTVTDIAFAYAVNALWQLPLLVLATEVTTRFAGRLPAATLHRIWFAAFVLALVMPPLSFLVSFQIVSSPVQSGFTLRTSSPESRMREGRAPTLVSPPAIRAGKDRPSSESRVPLSDAFALLYLGSVLFAILRLAVGLWRTKTLLSAAGSIDLSPDWQRNWQFCLGGFGIPRPRLLFSSTVSGPATIDWPLTVVILPAELYAAPEQEITAALCHELAHVRRKDFVLNLLCEFLGALLFFHPAWHWIRRRIRETRELACDDMAAEILSGRNAYAHSLLRLTQRMRSVADKRSQSYALGIFEGEILERRVMNLLNKKPRQSRLRTWFSIALSACLFLGLCIFALTFGLSPTLAQAPIRTDQPPAGWILAGSKPQDYRTGVDKGEIREGQPSAYLQSKVPTSGGFGTLMQSIGPTKYAGKRIRLRAWVKPRDVSDWAGLWLRVDKGQTAVAFDNMQNRAIKGTQSWRMHDVVLDVPEDATGIAFGILLAGTGQVWINHVSFEEVDRATATTGPNQPTTPVNLNFSQ